MADTMTTRGLTPAGAFDGLVAAMANGRFPGALLLTAPRGEGLPFLLDMAQGLLCQKPSGLEPCGECPDCKRFRTGHARLYWLLPQVSEEMAQKIEPYGPEFVLRDAWSVALPPPSAQIPIGGEGTDPTYPMMVAGVRGLAGKLAMSERERRIVLVPFAEQLNQSSSNALLKILEEPPSGVHFLLGAPSPDRVLPTIRSRSTLQNLVPSSHEQVVAFLRTRKVSEKAAQDAAKRAMGRPREALEFSSPALEPVRERAREWIGLCRHRDAEKAIGWILASEELQAKDRRASQLLLETALVELASEVGTTKPEELDLLERIRKGTEQALLDITQHARPQMAMTGAWLGLHA